MKFKVYIEFDTVDLYKIYQEEIQKIDPKKRIFAKHNIPMKTKRNILKKITQIINKAKLLDIPSATWETPDLRKSYITKIEFEGETFE